MLAVTDMMLDEEVPRDRLALLLKHFSQIKDERDPWRVLYPLSEVMLLVVCATICFLRRHRRRVESMHWLLDVEFGDDLCRCHSGHGAKNMAVVRRFALSLVRANKTKGSVKTRRKAAGWNPQLLLQILQLK
jgi:hypothetical protein